MIYWCTHRFLLYTFSFCHYISCHELASYFLDLPVHHVASCYKHTSVYMDNPGEPPIFWGPIFIHDNIDFESYSNFVNHLRDKLISTATSNLVIGSDEEYTLVCISQRLKVLSIPTMNCPEQHNVFKSSNWSSLYSTV
jgi:hypothetical protein